MKYFLVAERGAWDSRLGGYALRPLCVIEAESMEAVANLLGGEFDPEEGAVYIDKFEALPPPIEARLRHFPCMLYLFEIPVLHAL